MNIFKELPKDITNIILQYDGRIVCRNGKYINRIVNTDTAFPYLFERMKFDKKRSIIGGCFCVHIPIIITNPILAQKIGVIQKEFYYAGTNYGLSIEVVFSKDDKYAWFHRRLYSNK